MESTHVPPCATGEEHVVELPGHVLGTASAIFARYVECEDAAERRCLGPHMCEEPTLHEETLIYLRRAVPLVREKLSQEVLDLLPQSTWDASGNLTRGIRSAEAQAALDAQLYDAAAYDAAQAAGRAYTHASAIQTGRARQQLG